MANSRRRHILDDLSGREGADLDASMDAAWLAGFVPLSMTPRSAEFFLTILEHPAAQEMVKNSITCTSFEPMTEDEEKEREALFADVGPATIAMVEIATTDADPVAILRAVNHMEVLNLYKPHAACISMAVISSIPLIIAERDDVDLQTVKDRSFMGNEDGLFSELVSEFHADDPSFFAADSVRIMCQMFAMAIAYAEHDKSAFHAADIAVKLSTHGGKFVLAKYGRNDPCPCWSGKKYKKCCRRRREG